jgi:molecular chaperone DnaJ
MKIPSGTQSGTILKLREKGVANVNNGKKGDMLVTVNIETPTNLSKNQIEALKAFDKLESKQKPWDKFKNMFKN